MKEKMSSLERVLLALDHKEADRVPFDLGGSLVTGIHRVAYENLRKYLGMPLLPYGPLDPRHCLATVHDDLRAAWNIDVSAIYPNVPRNSSAVILDENGYSLTDEWGIEWKMPKDAEHYMMRQHPMAHIETVEDLKRYPFPNPILSERFDGMADAARLLSDNKQGTILGRASSGLLETSLYLRGYEDFYSDLVENRSFAEALLDKVLEFKINYWEKALPLVGDKILLISETDDLCDQRGPLISPKMYREVMKPRQRELFQFIKKKAQGRVHIMYHCCGAIRTLLPDFIEIGVDAMHPVQISAEGMEPFGLKRDFGKDIVFYGGGIDTQKTLPFGTVQEVKEEVRRNIEAFAPGGGFVFATVHNIDSDVPPQNIVAMWEALMEYGKY